MNYYWACIPNSVRKSKRISAEEKELWYEIREIIETRGGGYCTATNSELAKALDVSEKTITTRLASLIKKGFANITMDSHHHKRRIYLHAPGDHLEPQKPQGKELEERTKWLRESLKKAIVFGTIDFNVLIEKLKESSYLEEIQDNSVQFILTGEQIEFLNRFKRYQKSIDCQIACFPNVDYQKLVRAIEESLFLQDNSNLTLKWCLSHADEIINGKYKTSSMTENQYKNFEPRKYSQNELYQPKKSIFLIIISFF